MELFHQHGMSRNPQVQFFRVYPLNYSSLYAIMAATMSNLTVMFQFELDSSFSDGSFELMKEFGINVAPI